MTKQECAIVTAYTEFSMLRGDDLKYLYRYLSEIVGRPVYSHEIPAVCVQFRDKIKADFIALCRNASDDTEPEVRQGRLIEGKTFNDQRCSECGQVFRDDICFIYPADASGIGRIPKRCPECGCYWNGGPCNERSD